MMSPIDSEYISANQLRYFEFITCKTGRTIHFGQNLVTYITKLGYNGLADI